MAVYLFLLLLIVPVVELYVLIKLGGAFGILPTLGTMIAISLAGAWMLRRQGLAALGKANDAVLAGRMPVDSVVDGLGLTIAAALLMTPGFVTDLIGLALLVPLVRTWIGRSLLSRLMKSTHVTWDIRSYEAAPGRGRGAGTQGPVIEGEFTRLDDDKR